LSQFTEPTANHTSCERQETASDQIDHGEVARDEKGNDYGDRCGNAGLDDRSSRGLDADYEAPNLIRPGRRGVESGGRRQPMRPTGGRQRTRESP
jgi:hypothetical protein